MKWKPKTGEKFYTISLTGIKKGCLCYWYGNIPVYTSMLEAGTIFQTEEEAIAATELCLSALRGELVRREDVIKAIKKASKVNGCGYAPYDAGSRDCAHEIIKAVEEL